MPRIGIPDIRGQFKFDTGDATAPSMGFRLDTDTGIYTDTDDTLSFTTAATRRMSILPDGSLELVDISAPGVTTNKLYSVGGTLYWNGIDLTAGGSGTPGGADRQIQYNNAGAFGGDANLTYTNDGTNAEVRIIEQIPSYILHADTASANEGKWRIIAESGGGYLDFQGLSDAESSAAVFLRAHRASGSHAVDNVEFFDPIIAQNGSTVAPTYSFSAATNAGLFRDADTGIGLVYNGSTYLKAGPSNVSLGAELDMGGNAINDASTISFEIAGTERMKLTAPGGGDGTLWVDEGYYSTNSAGNSFLILDGSTGNVSFIDLRINGSLEANIYTNATEMEIQSAVSNDLYLCRGGGNVRVYHDLLFMDADESHSITLKSPGTVTTSRTWELPQDDPAAADGKFLTSNSSGVLSFAAALTAVVQDPSPQLGGDLDLNGSNIGTSIVAGAVDIEAGAAGAGVAGGPLSLIGGDGNAQANNGSSITLNGGTTTGGGGSAFVRGGNTAAVNGSGGGMIITAGAGDGSGSGGGVSIAAGSSGTGTPGDIDLNVGGSTGVGGQGTLDIKVGGTPANNNPPVVRLYEADPNGDYIGLQAPASPSGSRTWTLPDDDPSTVDGYLMTTNSSGELGFTPVPSVTNTTRMTVYEYLATAGQTAFSGTDQNGASLSYTPGQVLVFQNGTLLDPSDYTATSGTSVVLGTGASLNDEVNILALLAQSVDLTQRIIYEYTATAGQTTFTGQDDNGATLTYTDGELLVFKNGSMLDPDDYTATNGTDVVLGAGATAGDEVNIVRLAGGVSHFNSVRTYRYLLDTGDQIIGGSDENGNTLAYAVGLLHVFMNGAKLSDDEYKASDGSNVVLDTTVGADDTVIEIVTYSSFTTVDDAISQDNLIINGNMEIWQRGTTFTTASGYTADRFSYSTGGVADVTVARSSIAIDGSQYALAVTVTTPDVTIDAGDFELVGHVVEGYNMMPAQFGTSNAKNITLSFWVKSDLVGTYCVALRNGASDRSYVIEYEIETADTWEKKEMTIPGDTAGTWLYDEGRGLNILWTLASGSSFQTTPNTWTAGNYIATSNQVNFVGTLSNAFRITQVQCTIGNRAQAFKHRSIGQELALCQRYYCKTYNLDIDPGTVSSEGTITSMATSSGDGVWRFTFPVTMRIPPTITWYNPVTGSSSTPLRVSSGNHAVTTYQLGSTQTSCFNTTGGALNSNGTGRIHCVADAGL